MMRMRLLTIAAVCVLATGCASKSTPDEDVTKEKLPAEEQYVIGANALDARQYVDAIEQFETLEQEHPFSPWTKRAKVMLTYAYYLKRDYEDAIATAQSYARLYPEDEQTPYVYYLTAISYYERITDVGRDQDMTQRAKEALAYVIARYPGTDYAQDARLKLDLVTDHLAGKEMEVGRFYQKDEKFIPALNRFKIVMEHFDTTSHVPEALHRMTECYLALGLEDEAAKTAAVLGHNFPHSDWYKDSYRLLVKKQGVKPYEKRDELSPGWWSRLQEGVKEWW